MPPKNKGKKGRKQDDDDYWYVLAYASLYSEDSRIKCLREQAGTSALGNNLRAIPDLGEDDSAEKSTDSRLDLAKLDLNDGEDEDYGGLMVCGAIVTFLRTLYSCIHLKSVIKASTKRSKQKTRGSVNHVADLVNTIAGPLQNESTGATSQAVVGVDTQSAAEELPEAEIKVKTKTDHPKVEDNHAGAFMKYFHEHAKPISVDH